MKLAIATNDQETIPRGHFGERGGLGLRGAREQVKQTLRDAHESCLISNSIFAEVIVEPAIRA